MQKFNKNILSIIFMVFVGLWALSWVLPWTKMFESFPWARLLLSFAIFIIPGMAISLLLAGERFNLSTHFTSGLAISIFLIAILGLFGRIIKVPFDTVKLLFGLVGLIGLVILIKQFRSGSPLYKREKFSWTALVLISIIVFCFSVSYLIKNGGIGGDGLMYLAYLTNWQHAQPLSFQEIMYASNSADWIRFWLALFPMTTALLASISNIPGVALLGFYLEPCCVVVAILSIYNLYEDLLQSKKLAISAILLHVATFLVLRGGLQPGNIFFNRISEDKSVAGFILAPMFFLAVRFLLEKITWKSVIFFLFIGTSLALTHPVMLAYSIFIAGVYECIVTLLRKDYKKFIVTSALLLSIILAPASLRFINVPWVTTHLFGLEYDLKRPGSFDLESALNTSGAKDRISFIEGTPFYGFKAEKVRLQVGGNRTHQNPIIVFLSWSYLYVLGIGFVWSLFNIKKHPVAPFITAASLLILVCIIPYTGWIMGYLVSARLLWRAPWLFPIGLIGTVLATEAFNFMNNRILRTTAIRKIPVEYLVFGLVFLASLFMVNAFYINVNEAKTWSSQERISKNITRLTGFADLGKYIDKNIKQPTAILTDSATMETLLPGLSSKAKKVSYFRKGHASVDSEKIMKIREIFSTDMSITLEQRINILKTYRIQYLLIENSEFKHYYMSNPQFTVMKYISGYWLLKFQAAKP